MLLLTNAQTFILQYTHLFCAVSLHSNGQTTVFKYESYNPGSSWKRTAEGRQNCTQSFNNDEKKTVSDFVNFKFSWKWKLISTKITRFKLCYLQHLAYRKGSFILKCYYKEFWWLLFSVLVCLYNHFILVGPFACSLT